MRIQVIPKGHAYIVLPLGFGFTYAEKNGGLVLKTEVHWTKIKGFRLNTKVGCFWFEFRRIAK